MQLTPASLAFAALVLGASLVAPLGAQMPAGAPAATPSVFTLTPRVGFTGYTSISKISVRDDGSDPLFAIDGSANARLDTQLAFSLSGRYQPLGSRWGAFGDFARSSGGGELAARFCFDDPDFGRECDSGSEDADGSQWRLSAGVTRSFPFATTSSATLLLGAVYGRTHFELRGDEFSPTLEANESNPGVVIGAALDFPVTPRLGVRLLLHDAIMRVSGDDILRALRQDAAGLIVDSDPKIMNAVDFGVGLVLRL